DGTGKFCSLFILKPQLFQILFFTAFFPASEQLLPKLLIIPARAHRQRQRNTIILPLAAWYQ
ncbi:MAG TPA: hypothetical protein VLT51_03195, partial [Anaerolineales bacterium]|nr:hypothetical protein [Anaerolineales bacterium]